MASHELFNLNALDIGMLTFSFLFHDANAVARLIHYYLQPYVIDYSPLL
jgi:hypothetical protein